jgi:hypothetical protein
MHENYGMYMRKRRNGKSRLIQTKINPHGTMWHCGNDQWMDSGARTSRKHWLPHSFLRLIQPNRVGSISSTDFLKYNNYKNHIINNKNDKSKILNLQMAARHCLWRLYWNAPLPVTSLLKRVTVSDVFTEMRHYQWRVCLLQIPTAQIDTCACIFYSDKNPFLGKHATASGAFTQRRH